MRYGMLGMVMLCSIAAVSAARAQEPDDPQLAAALAKCPGGPKPSIVRNGRQKRVPRQRMHPNSQRLPIRRYARVCWRWSAPTNWSAMAIGRKRP